MKFFKWLKSLFPKKKLPNDAEEIQYIPFDIPDEGTPEFALISEAVKHLGLKETSKNYSTEIYLLLHKRTDWQRGWAWCMFFQNAIGIIALGGDWKLGKGGGTQLTYRKAKKNELTTQVPKPGYLMVWQNKNDKDHGHVEMFCGHKDEKIAYTIGGNVGDRSGIFERSTERGYSGKILLGYIKTY